MSLIIELHLASNLMMYGGNFFLENAGDLLFMEVVFVATNVHPYEFQRGETETRSWPKWSGGHDTAEVNYCWF